GLAGILLSDRDGAQGAAAWFRGGRGAHPLRGSRGRRVEGLSGRGSPRAVDGAAFEPGPMEALNPKRAMAKALPATRGGEGVGEWGWRQPLLMGLALAVITAVPYVYAYLAQPHGQVFMGFFF